MNNIKKTPMFKIEILSDVDSEKWNSKLLEVKQSSFYHTAEFVKFQSGNGRIPLFVYVYDSNDNVVAQFAIIIIKLVTIHASPFFRRFTRIISYISSRGEWHGPIIFTVDKDHRKEILSKIINTIDDIAQSHNLVFIEGKLPHFDILVDNDYKLEFKKNGYYYLDIVSFVIDLNHSIDSIWKNVTKKARGDVNRAKRRGVIIRELETDEDLKEYLLLVQRWNLVKGKEITEPLQDLGKLFDLHRSRIEKTFLAYQDGELVSGLSVGCFNGIATTHLVISSYAKSTSLSGTLLTWYALEWAKKMGMRYYDLTGGYTDTANNLHDEHYKHQWKGVIEYKQKWGGNEFTGYHFMKAKKKLAYKMYRLLVGLLLSYVNYRKVNTSKLK